MHFAFCAPHRGLLRIVSGVSLLMLLTLPGTFAQADSRSHGQLLPRQLATFEIVLGRIQLSQESFKIGSAHEHIPLANGGQRNRSISVSVLRGRPTLQFQDTGGEENWKIQVKAENYVDVESTSQVDEDVKTVTYHQPVKGPIRIEVHFGNGRPTQRAEAKSLWHLLLSDPSFFHTFVNPVLLRLEPTWAFCKTGEKVQELLRDEFALRPTSKATLEALAKLDSPSATERLASSLELEKLGLAAKIELQSALERTSNSHQRSAISKLLSGIEPTGNDSAMRVAVWLSGDREFCPANAASTIRTIPKLASGK